MSDYASKLKTIGGLRALRRLHIESRCIITCKTGNLKPAIVRIKYPCGREMRVDGMVHSSVKAGKKTDNRGKIASVIRSKVSMKIQTSKKGLIYANCQVA